MQTEVMAFPDSDFWSPDGEDSSNERNLPYSPIMAYQEDSVGDQEAQFSGVPSMTPDCSTGTNSTNLSDPYRFDFSSQLHPSNTYPSAFHWANRAPYSEFDPSTVKQESSVEHPMIDGNARMYSEPQSYAGFPNDPTTGFLQMSDVQNGPSQYHGTSSLPPWSTIPSSWGPENVELKDSSVEFEKNVLFQSTTAPSALERSDNNADIICKICEDNKTFSRTADLKRHMETIHQKNITYSCGCCDDTLPRLVFTRKDKLLIHKRKVHGYPKQSDGSLLKKCLHKDCVTSPDSVFFCSAENLERHNAQSHKTLELEGLSRVSYPNSIQNPHTLPLSSAEWPSTSARPSATTKRHHTEQPTDASKRTKVGEAPKVGEETSNTGELFACPEILSNTHILENHDDHDLRANYHGSMELLKPNSRSSDLLLISQLNTGRRSRSASMETLISQLEKLGISFNIAERSMKVQDDHYDAASIMKSKVGALLSQHSFDRRQPQRPSFTTQSIGLGGIARGRAGINRSISIRTFAMRRDLDDPFVNVWHSEILPLLPEILTTTIGGNYTATLVRKGELESTSQAVIQIQCPKLPSLKLREHIRSRITNPTVGKFPDISTRIEFKRGSLALLSGDTSLDLDEEDDGDYPYYKRFWKTPGMGAPIGLDCTESVSATLGCYVHVDSRLYILTVKHFIPKSHQRLMSGTEPTLTLASPPRLEVKETQLALQQLLRGLDCEIRQTWTSMTGQEKFNLEEILSLPEEISILLQKLDAAHFDLLMLEGDASRFRLGIVERQSTSPTNPSQVRPETSQCDLVHHMDWALCTVDRPREGSNRHRYQYDEISQQMDFVGEDVDKFGAGKLCVETGPVEPGAKVHFVGQSSGLQHGTISSARMQVTLNGVSTWEWTMVVDSQQADDKDFHGDSGASIIQDRDRKLIGHLWGCVGTSLIFAPITAVFDDIRKECKAQAVCLPPAPHGPPQVELICRDAMTEIRKPPKKIKASKMQIPRLLHNTRTISLGTQLEDKIAQVLKERSNFQFNKHSIHYILAPPHPELSTRKHKTFPLYKQTSKWEPLKLKHRGASWPDNASEPMTFSAISV